ncbi:hypothetical protein [Mucisphaera sp.]|uniref:hypothetical protein n=1 Tax=Mucisphaera sp. TaxID=2913024 RepID=UPI003D12FED7
MRWGFGLVVLVGVVGMGCAEHRLSGVVTAGAFSGVDVVGLAALPKGGVSGARVEVVLDPGTLDREVLAVIVTDGRGRFEVDERWFAERSNWLDIEASVGVSAAGLVSERFEFVVPRGDRGVVLTVVDPALAGESGVGSDLYQEMLEHRERFERR